MGFPTIGYVIYVTIENLSLNGISYTSCYYIRENWNTIVIWEFVHTVMLSMWKLKHSRHIGFRKICVVKYVKIRPWISNVALRYLDLVKCLLSLSEGQLFRVKEGYVSVFWRVWIWRHMATSVRLSVVRLLAGLLLLQYVGKCIIVQSILNPLVWFS